MSHSYNVAWCIRLCTTHITSATDFSLLRNGTRIVVFNAHLFRTSQVSISSSILELIRCLGDLWKVLNSVLKIQGFERTWKQMKSLKLLVKSMNFNLQSLKKMHLLIAVFNTIFYYLSIDVDDAYFRTLTFYVWKFLSRESRIYFDHVSLSSL